MVLVIVLTKVVDVAQVVGAAPDKIQGVGIGRRAAQAVGKHAQLALQPGADHLPVGAALGAAIGVVLQRDAQAIGQPLNGDRPVGEAARRVFARWGNGVGK